MERLLPDPGPTTIAEQLEGLDLGSLTHDERPYVVSNFALTLDGRTTIGGRSREIGSDTDTEMLVGLRECVDAVLIGAGTMRTERYGLPHGLMLVIVSGSLDLPWDAPVFTDSGGRCLICTDSGAEPPETAASVEVLRQPDGIDLGALLRTLRAEHGVRALLCEGGPRLHAQLIEDELLDELFVTHAPKLAGDQGPGLVTGLAPSDRRLDPVWLLHEPATGEVFARYRASGR